MPEKAFSQRPVEALYDALIPVDVNPTAPNLDRVLRQQLTDGAHELVPRVNLNELWPPQGAPLENPSKAIGDLSLFVAAGDVNDRESIAEDIPFYTVVWQKEQVGLGDLVWHRHVKLWPWYVPWGGEVDMSDGLFLEPVIGLMLSHLCCSRQLFYGCEPLPLALGVVINVRKLPIWLH